MFRKLKNSLVEEICRTRKENNVILSVPRMGSQKPDQIYDTIEGMCNEGQGGFLEIFARPHNQREGWVGIGNEAIDWITPPKDQEMSVSSEEEGGNEDSLEEVKQMHGQAGDQ